jgi:hypothetical protein
MWVGLTLGLHLAFVAAASGIPLAAAACGGFDEPQARARYLARLFQWSMVLLLAGGLTGLLLGALVWRGAFSIGLQRLASRAWFGAVEYLFSLALLGVAWVLMRGKKEPRPSRFRWAALLALVAATNLLYHFPPLFFAIRQIAAESALPAAELTSAEARAVIFSAPAVWRWLHFVDASIVVGCLACILVAGRPQPAHQAGEAQLRWRRHLAIAAFAGAGLQWPIGWCVWMTMKRSDQWAISGGSAVATGWFLQCLALALIALWLGWRLVRFPADRKLAAACLAAHVVIINAMAWLNMPPAR